MNANGGASAAARSSSPFFLAQVALPVIAVVAALAISAVSVALLAAQQSNQIAVARQEVLIRTMLDHQAAVVGQQQESVTIWDESKHHLSAPKLDYDWLDKNLGIWLNDSFGHDEAYILGPQDQPLYAMRDGLRQNPQLFDRRIEPVVQPLIAELRGKLAREDASLSAEQRSVDSHAFALVGGWPAIVSVKPVLGNNAKTPQGSKVPIHISVRRLNDNLLKELAPQYQLAGARFTRSFRISNQERAVPLRGRGGNPIGYFVWRPFSPGVIMMKRIAPFALAGFMFMLGMVLWLLFRIRTATLALEASQAQARHLAFHDPLTGLGNRTLFEDRLGRALADAERSGDQIALHFLDLDHFKQVNDALGHPAGDELISIVARRLAAQTRQGDFLARIGGDMFAIVQTAAGSPAAAEIFCMRIIGAISEPLMLAGTKIDLCASIGVALAPAHATSRTELARKADIALFEAKHTGRCRGRSRYVFFHEYMDDNIQYRREIEDDLRNAIEAGDQFELVYQPLFAAKNGAITGAEALIRWNHPAHGSMSPAAFIPIAETTGMIDQIGAWTLERACSDCVLLDLPTVAVNVSAVQLRDPGFSELVSQTLRNTGLAPERLELEITETALIDGPASCKAMLAAIRGTGVKIALDDFGTGYSSFTHLHQFEIDRIKIDQSFVQSINAKKGSPIIRAIVGLARAGRIDTTAEGVETEGQKSFLIGAGCTTLQGYLLSRPVSAHAIGEMLRPEKMVARSR